MNFPIPSFEVIPVHYGYVETVRTQRSFPRSKKKRIRERWAKRKDNFTETTIHRMMFIYGKIYTSPEVFKAIARMNNEELQDISGTLKKSGITVRITMHESPKPVDRIADARAFVAEMERLLPQIKSPWIQGCSDIAPMKTPICQEIPTDSERRARLAIEKMRGEAAVVGVCDEYVVLAQDQTDLKNKMGKIRSGDTQGFYTVKQVLGY